MSDTVQDSPHYKLPPHESVDLRGGNCPTSLLWPAALDGDTLPFDASEVSESLPTRFRRIAAAFPDHIAVSCRGEQITYDGLHRRANMITSAIQSHLGLSGTRILLLLEQGADAIAAIWGVLVSGNAYVPLDTSYPESRLARIATDSGATLIVTNNKNAERALKLASCAMTVLNIDSLPFGTVPTPVDISPDDTAYVIYTSGSTGEPKGVIQTHRNVLFDIRRQIADLSTTTSDRYGMLFAPSSSASVVQIFGAHLAGASVSPFDIRAEGFAGLIRWLDDEQITILDLNVATFRDLCRILPVGQNFPHLRLLSPGSEPVYERDVAAYKRHFSDTCLLQNALGTTETRTVTQVYMDKSTVVDGPLVPVGYPIPGKDVLLLDESGNDAPHGEAGEIAVRSRYLSPGYLGRPDQTAAAFLQTEVGSDERIYLTGDLGRFLPDGQLVHLGRKDFQIKVRGFRVEVAEVETALARLPGIADAAVALKDMDGGQILVAYLIVDEGSLLSIGEMRRQLSLSLPAHEVPDRFEFIDSMPRTLNGKLDRKALPDPSAVRAPGTSDREPPRDSLVKTLVRVFEDVLGYGPIGARESFFDLGGNSLQVARLVVRIHELTGEAIPLSAVIDSPSPFELAAYMRRTTDLSRHRSPVPLSSRGDQLPLFCVPGRHGDPIDFLKLAKHMGDERPIYAFAAKDRWAATRAAMSLDEVSTQYANDIRRTQPVGPYHLCGFSAGGAIAFDVAQRLMRDGDNVAFLGLLDTYAPGTAFLDQSFPCRRRRLEYTVKVWARPFASLYYALFWQRMSGRLSAKFGNYFERLIVDTYRPKPYLGRLHYIQATRFGTLEEQRQRVDGWRCRATDTTVVNVDAQHYLLAEPDVQLLATALRDCLADVNPNA
ncbi:MAG TPA: AMP-binding protein [Capsulimonadaceae bacterium]|jgi:amino acid adenylation domain-containing protein